MKNRIPIAPGAQSARGKKEYPPMMDPELEEIANDLNPSERLGMATRLERWALELRWSTALIEKMSSGQN